MKNFKCFLVAVVLLTAAGIVNAQTFGLKAGYSSSDISVEDEDGSYNEDISMKSGFHVGPTLEFPVSENFSIDMALLLATKGAKADESDSFEGETYSMESKVNMWYLDIPVFAKFSTFAGNTRIYGLAGPYLGVGLTGKVKMELTEGSESYSEEDDISWGDGDDNDFKRLDLGIGLGAGIEFDSFFVELTTHLGLNNISAEEDYGTKIKNRTFMLSVGYKFNNQ